MQTLKLYFPKKLVFGNGCSENFIGDYKATGLQKLLLVTTPPLLDLVKPIVDEIKSNGTKVFLYDNVTAEPAIEDLEETLRFAEKNNIDSVVGVGGGSVLDLAKLIAAMLRNEQTIQEVFGIGKLNHRGIYLGCMPTTSGTGSEVSPNAILLDNSDNLKKGVVSPFLVPDGAYVDPLLTKSVPPPVTAATGLDALTHCIEVYTNKFAHPIIDMYAIEGIRLISQNLIKAYNFGENESAREKVALGSLYGGIGLGPVNTAAVHALSYPLGGEFHVAHGLSNAVLLPHVMRFNMGAAVEKYAETAVALGAEEGSDNYETASNGIEKIFELCEKLNVPPKLSTLNIPYDALYRMAKSAIKVDRLLKNNPRKITLEDAQQIYKNAY
jgi:alcohol dehydrogenase class IV